MKTKKLIITFLIVQLTLIWISISKDVDITDFENIIFIPLFAMGWSIFSGIFALLLNKNNIFDFVSKFTFFSISGFNILALIRISFGVLFIEPLRESLAIFIIFPIGGFYIFIGSIILGIIAFLVRKKLKERNNFSNNS